MASNNGGGEGAGRALNGRYQLIGLVGGGGMAQVYKARDNVLGRTVAVKLLREQYVNDSQFVARFRREAQAAANLAHPNIVNVYDVGQDGDLHYIVMEYIAGDNLKDLIQRSAPLPTDRAVSIAIQILAGLEYAHRSGLIHRDVKSQNVLIAPEGGVVKVTDFGIAKSVSDLGLTEAGTALGTAHYFSPEQARGERVVPQSDIYAVGVTMYEMLTGHLPFESDNIMGLAYKHISEPPRPVRQLNPSVPARLEAIVMKALAKTPAERFSSASEMEKALRAVQAGGQQPTVEVPVGAGGRGGRQVPAATTRVGGRSVVGGASTGSLRTGNLGRGAYAAPVGGGAAAATRHMTSPLGAPTSVAIRPAPAGTKSGGAGCSVAAIGLLVAGLLGVLILGGIFLVPQIQRLISDPVVPSPTPSPTVPTATPSPTTVPPTFTPTFTPTQTPTATPTPPSVPVPKLVGLRIQDAIVLAKQRGFNVLELDRIDSPEWGAGIVAQQDPQENAILQQTNAISVRVSNGPPPFKLPQLTNTDPEAAKATLESAGLKVVFTYEGSLSIPKGVVIRSEPVADASVRSGDTVTLVVSRGEVVEVPDLRGTENIDVVQDRLDAIGLTLGNVTEEDDPTGGVPPGAVLGQEPPAGRLVEKGTPIDIRLRRRE